MTARRARPDAATTLRRVGPALLAGALAALVPAAASAQPRHQDPDWPCVQRFVPRLSAETLWPDLPPATGPDAWRDEPAVAALVARAAPRAVEERAGAAMLREFLAALPTDPVTRARLPSLAFAGLVAETNRQRDELVAALRRFARRQREVAELANRLATELHALPEDASGAQRAELEQRRFFVAKAFEDAERTLRYACQGPVALESRLGGYARVLREGAGPG